LCGCYPAGIRYVIYSQQQPVGIVNRDVSFRPDLLRYSMSLYLFMILFRIALTSVVRPYIYPAIGTTGLSLVAIALLADRSDVLFDWVPPHGLPL